MPSTIIEPVEAKPPSDRAQDVLGLSDLALARRLYERTKEVMDDDLKDDLYFLIGEVVERWAPEVELADRILSHADSTHREDEIEAELEGIVGRFAARVQLQSRRACAQESLVGDLQDIDTSLRALRQSM